MRFSGKTAVVTGAARGIGLAVAKALSNEGASVILADRDEAEGRAAAAGIASDGGDAEFHVLDVTSAAGWETLREHVGARQGLDILVNCAGRAAVTPISETSWEAIRAEFDINLGGVYLGIRTLAPLLADRPQDGPWAAIVNLSSMAALSGVPFFGAYGASKAAVSSFTKTAALEFARLKQPIRVNAVLPGTIDTEMTRQLQEDLQRFGATAEELRAQSIARHPIGRLGVADDIMFAVLYLADDRASFTTGLNLTVSGGRDAL